MKIDKQKLYTLKDERNQVLEAADAALDAGNMEEYEAKLAEVKGYNAQIESVEKLLQEQERFAGQPADASGGPGLEREGQEDGYAKAVKSFADAARSGFRVAKAAGDMMQEGVDADGGYAVPQDTGMLATEKGRSIPRDGRRLGQANGLRMYRTKTL